MWADQSFKVLPTRVQVYAEYRSTSRRPYTPIAP